MRFLRIRFTVWWQQNEGECNPPPAPSRIAQNGIEQGRDFIEEAVALLARQRAQNGLANVSSHPRIPVGGDVGRGNSCTLCGTNPACRSRILEIIPVFQDSTRKNIYPADHSDLDLAVAARRS